MRLEVELEWVKLEHARNCFDTKHTYLFYYYFLNENNFFKIDATGPGTQQNYFIFILFLKKYCIIIL